MDVSKSTRFAVARETIIVDDVAVHVAINQSHLPPPRNIVNPREEIRLHPDFLDIWIYQSSSDRTSDSPSRLTT